VVQCKWRSVINDNIAGAGDSERLISLMNLAPSHPACPGAIK